VIGATILVVDDEPAIHRFLTPALEANGFVPLRADTAAQGLAMVASRKPAVVVLDLGLPDMDGAEVIRRLRGWTDVPIIVLSARDRESTKVEALDLGADDYVTKPFDTEELFARVRAALRRRASGDAPLVVQLGTVRLDVTERRAVRDGADVRLTPTEWRIVESLARREGRLVRQAELLHEVWGPGYDRETNYLRVYLAQLRRKLETDPSRPAIFLTDPGIGYRMATGPVTAPR